MTAGMMEQNTMRIAVQNGEISCRANCGPYRRPHCRSAANGKNTDIETLIIETLMTVKAEESYEEQ